MGVRLEHRATTAIVTLDWPEQRNALDAEGAAALRDALADAAGSDDTSVVVLTGNGAFCSGGNLRGVANRTSHPVAERRSHIAGTAQAVIRAVVDVPVPVLAAIDGPAVGLGFDLALACDARFVGPDGWCQQGWGKLGLLPGGGGELLLRRCHPSLLWRLLAEQPRIGPADAERWGVGEAVVEGTALEAAVVRAEQLGRLPRQVLEAYASLFRTDLQAGLADHLERCADAQAELLADPELRQRITELLGAPAPSGGPRPAPR